MAAKQLLFDGVPVRHGKLFPAFQPLEGQLTFIRCDGTVKFPNSLSNELGDRLFLGPRPLSQAPQLVLGEKDMDVFDRT